MKVSEGAHTEKGHAGGQAGRGEDFGVDLDMLTGRSLISCKWQVAKEHCCMSLVPRREIRGWRKRCEEEVESERSGEQ